MEVEQRGTAGRPFSFRWEQRDDPFCSVFRFSRNRGTTLNGIKISFGDVENQSREAWWNLLTSFKKHLKQKKGTANKGIESPLKRYILLMDSGRSVVKSSTGLVL